MAELLLIRFGEMTLKSAPVRKEFERTLRRNILEQFTLDGLPCRLRSDYGHLYVEVDSAARGLRLLRRVFGITSASQVFEVATDPALIGAELLRRADDRLTPQASFAVRARRTGQHTFTSQELARDLGGVVLDRWPERALHVDLEHPNVELFVEVRGARTYLSFDRTPGPGGIPLGVAGRVVALVDGRRGALGAYLMMKRGCRCGLVVVSNVAQLVDDVLRRFDPKVESEPSDSDSATWGAAVEHMLDRTRADGVVLPLTVEDYPAARVQFGDRVLFSPTVGLTDEEVDQRWQEIERAVA
ncbi:MAG: THUMP domain-containing protein [Thermoplasmata archaeon]